MATGVIKTITDKGFGFIKPDGEGKDVFFHNSKYNGDFASLQTGMKVEFDEGMGEKGPYADNVVVVG